MKELTPIEILEKLDMFYNNAWNKLILFTTILLAIVGVIIPLIINWWQNRNLKLREKDLKNEITSFFDEKLKDFKKDLSSSIEEKYKDELKKMKYYQLKIQGKLEGAQFLLQANSQSDIKDKLNSLYWSARGYINGKDFLNLQTVIDLIVKNIPKLKDEDLIELKANEVDFEDIIIRLKKINENYSQTKSMRDIKVALTKVIKNATQQKL